METTITLQAIKKLIEKYSNVNGISKKTRKKPYPELRSIYCKIAYNHTSETISYIGSIVNIEHSTVISSIKTFDDLYSVNQLKYLYVFEKVTEEIIKFTEQKDTPMVEYFLKTNKSIYRQLAKKSKKELVNELRLANEKITQLIKS